MRYLVLSLLIVLQSCTSASYKQYAFNDNEGLNSDEGVILFRAINKNMSDKISGFLLNFTNLETGEVIQNTPGIWGYPKQTEFALRVPKGEYELSYVFLYDGGVSSNGDGFKVNIIGGEYIYAGTILKSWGLPRNPSLYGDLTGMKSYSAKVDCGFWECGTKDAEVYIFSNGIVPSEIFQQYPNLNESEVNIRLLN